MEDTIASDPGPAGPTPTDPHVDGEVVLYRLYDVGHEIDLARAFRLLGESAPERPRPVRGEALTLQIPNPPVTVGLGREPVEGDGLACVADLSARIFDFGVVSLRARVAMPSSVPWPAFVAAASACASAVAWRELFPRVRDALLDRIRPTITKPGPAPVTEDYAVYRIHRLADADGRPCGADVLVDGDIARLLLAETRALTASARRDLLSSRFSYFEDDLAVLTWSAALIVEPDPADSDVQYVLEFANAQLLELRYYDAVLDRELPHMYEQVRAARHGFHLLGRRYSRLLADLQTRVAEATELVERTENSLKVTDDVFLARIYAAALEIFRGRAWRAGVDGKLAIVRDTYAMLNGESLARRSEVLELVIVLLILFEIVFAFVRP